MLVIASFSGGGTRAAALAHGTLETLRDVTLTIGGRERRLLDEIDIINAVSGGSIAAAYYAMHRERIFDDFERRSRTRQPAAVRRRQRDRSVDRRALPVHAGPVRPAVLGSGQRAGRPRGRRVGRAAAVLQRDHAVELRGKLRAGLAAGHRRRGALGRRCSGAGAATARSAQLSRSGAPAARASGRPGNGSTSSRRPWCDEA